MDECQHAMEELRNIVEGISNLRDTAYAHYSLLVEQVLKDQITDEQQLGQYRTEKMRNKGKCGKI